MAYLLGVDTGGTYTDAVILRDEEAVVARAKRLTTRHDLAEGIGAAVAAVLEASGIAAGEIGMASLSTTLATNALVEGQGGRAALVAVGFREADLQAQGLAAALAGDPLLILPGGHDHAGEAAEALDMAALEGWLAEIGGVAGFAVAGRFAVRNPAHELAVAERLRALTGRPVSLSHQLSAKLNGPKRALTALLNARLIGMVERLIGRAEEGLRALGIAAPLMVVRGDGALIPAAMARERPIETILSGPAASLVGARWLTGAEDALVSDIGGTTTDVAVLRGGRPAIDPEGARVGGFRTMVEAVAMRTYGLGGDSEVHPVLDGLAGGVRLGPRRLVPVSLIATEAPEVVLQALEAQARRAVAMEHDGRFLRPVADMSPDGLTEREAALLARIDGVQPVGAVLRDRRELAALERLVARGLVQVAGVTPSDAAHVLGALDAWDGAAATLALGLMARRRVGHGGRLAAGPEALAQMIVDRLRHQTEEILMECALAEDGGFDAAPGDLARHELMRRGLGGREGIVTLRAGLGWPVVGLGASAGYYYPPLGDRLETRIVLPGDAGVANAIGAVVGRVTIRRQGTLTVPAPGCFRLHLAGGTEDFATETAALQRLEEALQGEVAEAAEAAGAVAPRITTRLEARRAEVEGQEVLIEAEMIAEAVGRARVSTPQPSEGRGREGTQA
ncbi:hydantoinase/oxoprolinase family protein [Aquicoccus sp. SCR17]|nr:hydantoinase/oxoprolinase family protein [Carideicomes alvinocaridis]